MDSLLIPFTCTAVLFLGQAYALFWWHEGDIFGIAPSHYLWFFIFGQVVTGYKLLNRRDCKRTTKKEIFATFLLGSFFSLNIAPMLELRLSRSVHETTAYLALLILMGELGIFFVVSKLLGVSLETTHSPNKEDTKKNDKTP